MRVKFNLDRTTKDANPQTFKAGEVYELPDASARHWINRGVAEEVVETASVRRSSRPEAMVPSHPAKGE